jgi:hypothetical protein
VKAAAGEAPGLAAELEASARARFVRWDAALWKELLEGPARALAEALQREKAPLERAQAVLSSYLRLGCEAIGLGYLFPSSSGTRSFFALAWTELVPRLLPALPYERQLPTLAALWNLGENLEGSPVWQRRIFFRVGESLTSLADLDRVVAEVSRQALEPPAKRLAAPLSVCWIHLAEEDQLFLPGRVHFPAPAVACIHDRHRGAAAGREAPTLGVWLAEPPLVLGPMGCAEEVRGDSPLPEALWPEVLRADPRVTDPFDDGANAWRGAVTLETSQFLVGIAPS